MIINKTPHPVNIIGGTTFPACPKNELIRLLSETVVDTPINGVPTSITIFGEPEGLPESGVFCPSCGQTTSGRFWNRDWSTCDHCDSDILETVYYIVSQLVKSACPGRDDLLVPAEVVRDNSGNIIGCRSLGR